MFVIEQLLIMCQDLKWHFIWTYRMELGIIKKFSVMPDSEVDLSSSANNQIV